jgi:hypothetical protein
MITEIEALYARLDSIRMSPADRHLARVRLEQAEALADLLHKAVAALARLIRGRSARAPRSSDLQVEAAPRYGDDTRIEVREAKAACC